MCFTFATSPIWRKVIGKTRSLLVLTVSSFLPRLRYYADLTTHKGTEVGGEVLMVTGADS